MRSEQPKAKVRGGFFSREGKLFVDILLVVVFFVATAGSHMEMAYESYWQSGHCITGLVWFGLVVVHVVQNWRMIRAFAKRKVIKKNKITFFTTIIFVLMLLSILSFVVPVGFSFRNLHHIIGRLFVFTILIHVVDKFKRFVSLWKK